MNKLRHEIAVLMFQNTCTLATKIVQERNQIFVMDFIMISVASSLSTLYSVYLIYKRLSMCFIK